MKRMGTTLPRHIDSEFNATSESFREVTSAGF